MKNFKPGQEVVYKRLFVFTENFSMMNIPKDNEIVTIDKICKSKDPVISWHLKEYACTICGKFTQSFDERNLFPLEEIAKEETDKILADLETSFIPERDLILN